MVAKGKDGKPTPVPGVIPETEAEKMLFNSASERKKKRLEKR
jgi:acyl-CoA hydrolase